MLLLILSKIYINYDKKRHNLLFCDKVHVGKEGESSAKN